MKTDYQFLVGRDFYVGNDIYTIRSVVWSEEYVLVEANEQSSALDMPTSLRLPLAQVLQSLLVEEEIELFNPSYLSIASSY